MKIKSQLIVLLSSVLFAVGGLAFGSSVNVVASDRIIYACVTGVNGNITKVSNVAHTCPKGTTPISWNQQGPQGIQGDPGTKGDKGDRGDAGAAGETVSNQFGMVPWYLADETGIPKLVPIDFTVVPTSNFNGATDVMIDGMVVGVRLLNGEITNPTTVKRSPIFYPTDDCTGNVAYAEGSKNAYYFEDPSTPQGWKGVSADTTPLLVANSTGNFWLYYSNVLDYVGGELGLYTWHVYDHLNHSYVAPNCWRFSIYDLQSVLNAAYDDTFPLTGAETQEELWERQYKVQNYLWQYIMKHQLGELGYANKPANIGPLQVVSNY